MLYPIQVSFYYFHYSSQYRFIGLYRSDYQQNTFETYLGNKLVTLQPELCAVV